MGCVCALVAVQVIGDKSNLQGIGCYEHGCLLCRSWASQSGVGEIQLMTGECLICLPIVSLTLHCNVSHHSTSVKVQNCCFSSVEVQNGYCTNLGV